MSLRFLIFAGAIDPIEDGSTAMRKSHLASIRRVARRDLDKAIYERVLPYGMSRARTPPRFRSLVIGPMTIRYPGKELYHQQAHRLRHRVPFAGNDGSPSPAALPFECVNAGMNAVARLPAR
jgi:hypothetical protein